MEPRESVLSRPVAMRLAAAEYDRCTERYAARAPKAAAGRRRTPAFVRSRTMPQSQELNGVTEPWTLATSSTSS